ncbi:hypothetical protein MNV49_000542 [Pseudohyphozyma bogoriensis]|nr:hypothetical protein MNV49_000542 [Pseudohyphozyma bogoriensis]
MSPAMSHSNLTALLGAYSPTVNRSGSASPSTLGTHLDMFPRSTSGNPQSPSIQSRPSPFSFSYQAEEDDESESALNDDARHSSHARVQLAQALSQAQLAQDHEDALQWEDNSGASTSEAEVVDLDSTSSDEGTQLGPRHHRNSHSTSTSAHHPRTRAIPITGGIPRGRSNSDSLPAPSTSFSPIQSRPLTLGPSAAKERGGRVTDLEDERLQPDEAFKELMDAAKVFMDMSTRGSGASSSGTINSRKLAGSSGLAAGGSAGVAEQPTTPTRTTQQQQWTPDPVSSPASSFPSSDPQLASSVAPSIELSSGPDFDEVSSEKRSRGEKGAAESNAEDGAEGRGWFGWWRRTVEIKVWHLVGLAGLLITAGVGLGVGTLINGAKFRAGRLSLFR